MLLWAAEDRLSRDSARTLISDADVVFVSAVSVWEIEIKRALGRLRAPEDVAALVRESGFQPFSITFEHAREAGRLPSLHADPFDRMLIAQARVADLTLATADSTIGRYDVPVLDLAPD